MSVGVSEAAGSMMLTCLLGGVLSLIILVGVWVYERLPRWRAADARARREPLSETQFGERFFAPDRAKIAARLRGIASKEFGRDLTRLHPDDALAQTLVDESDSLDSVEMLMTIEEEFGVELDEATAVEIKTFRDLVNAVAARRPFLVKWRRTLNQAIEERFGASLPRDVLVKVPTPGELADAVATELKEQVTTQPSCQSQQAFYLLRNAMAATLNLPRSLITPTTLLRPLLRSHSVPAVWVQLRDTVAARRWPPLVRPRWMGWLVYGLPLLFGAAIVVGVPWLWDQHFVRHDRLNFWMRLVVELRVWIAIPMVICSWLLLVRRSTRCKRSLPRTICTVSDLVPFVATSVSMTWSREEIDRQIRDIVVARLRLPPDRYEVGGRFVEDFNLEVGMEER